MFLQPEIIFQMFIDMLGLLFYTYKIKKMEYSQ